MKKKIVEIFKKKGIEYADNNYPNTPENMEDEHQWQKDWQGYSKGAEDVIEYILSKGELADGIEIVEVGNKICLVSSEAPDMGSSYIFKENGDDSWNVGKLMLNVVAEGGVHPLNLINAKMIRKKIIFSIDLNKV